MSSQPSACERLAQSRERLRQAMQQIGSRPGEPGSAGVNGVLGDLLGSLQAPTSGSLVGDLLQAWWRKQPLRVALLLAGEAIQVLLQPVARRHPYALVAGAATAGALVVLARPWRWVSTTTLLASLWPQVISEAMRYLRPSPRSRHDHPPP